MKMVAFDNIEDIFQQIRAFNDNSRAAVTLVTAIGALYVTYALIKLSYRIIIGKCSLSLHWSIYPHHVTLLKTLTTDDLCLYLD